MLSSALALSSASALSINSMTTRPASLRTSYHAIVMQQCQEPPPPGFEWGLSPVEVAQPTAAPVSAADPAPVTADAPTAPVAAVSPTKPRKSTPTGPFAPLVVGAKNVMGTKELNALRADIIGKHTKVISAFVDTSESSFGQLVLRRMFEAADKDGNGTLDREEILDALHALGFTFVKEKQLDQMIGRGDVNDDDVIDFEEFVTEAPRSLRTNLVKLAKQNGHDLGFLA